jgi:hypothetical protein
MVKNITLCLTLNKSLVKNKYKSIDIEKKIKSNKI